MSKTIELIVFNIQSFVILLSFLFSLKLVKNKAIPYYMNYFFWYPLVALIIAIPLFIIANFFWSYYRYGSILNVFSLIFHYSFLSFFIIKVMPNNQNKRFPKILFIVFLFLIIAALTIKNVRIRSAVAFPTANLGLVVFSVIYYYKLFNNLPVLDLKNEPSFWIITGVFFCMSIHIPLSATVEYLYHKIPTHNLRIFMSLGAFCYIIMHIFFIKAFLCSIHPQKSQ